MLFMMVAMGDLGPLLFMFVLCAFDVFVCSVLYHKLPLGGH